MSILGCLVAVALQHRVAQTALREFGSFDALYIGCGALIGTMLALVLTISILPIQRSVETHTPSVTVLYRRDFLTSAVFVALGSLTMASFVFSVDGVLGISNRTLFVVQVIFVGVSIDLIRLHQRHITVLMEPGEAIHRLATRAVRGIRDAHRNIRLVARIQWWFLSEEEKKEKSRDVLESAWYAMAPQHQHNLNGLTSELFEIAVKAISRGELSTVSLAVNALTMVVVSYSVDRKANLILMPRGSGLEPVLGSDIDGVVVPVYDHLKNINRAAVAAEDEASSIAVVGAFREMAVHLASIRFARYPDRVSQLTWLPIGYLRECAAASQLAGKDDVALSAALELYQVAVALPEDTHSDDYQSVIEAWHEIAMRFLVSGKGALADKASAYMRDLLFVLLRKSSYHLGEVLDMVLEQAKMQLHAAITVRDLSPAVRYHAYLSGPYDLTQANSLAYLLDGVAGEVEADRDNEVWGKAFDKFVSIDKRLWRSLKDVVEEVDLSGRPHLRHLLQTIRHIATVHLRLVRDPLVKGFGSEDDLLSNLQWYLSCVWRLFKDREIQHRQAEDACDVLAWVGLSYYDAGHKKVAESACGHIRSILEMYCEPEGARNPYDIADLLMRIYYLRLLADHGGDATTVSFCDKHLSKPDCVSEGKWGQVLEALQTRKGQLQNDITRHDPIRMLSMHEARSLLASLLR